MNKLKRIFNTESTDYDCVARLSSRLGLLSHAADVLRRTDDFSYYRLVACAALELPNETVRTRIHSPVQEALVIVAQCMLPAVEDYSCNKQSSVDSARTDLVTLFSRAMMSRDTDLQRFSSAASGHR